MTSKPLLSATSWRDNAALISDVMKLYAPPVGGAVIDLTYGEGVWWRGLTHGTAMLVPFTGDFTDTGIADDSYDVVLYDPPYVSTGGRDTTTIPEFYDRYGLKDCPENPHALQTMIHAGLREAARIVTKRPKGRILAKSMNYISSGRLWCGTKYMADFAEAELGLEIVEWLTHVGGASAQPKDKSQVHFRNNASSLLILQPRGRRKELWP